MCGIAGIVFEDGRPVDPSLLGAMAESLAHRGPDAQGLWTAPGVGLAHRRLSIIDLSGGDQPIANEDGSVQVVFNGEIYNYRQLRRELESRGHRFQTASDTEVLVHLYEEMGEELVVRLRGMFALALWDERRRQLLLARDRLGLKPLYYYCDRHRFVFASELKALLQDADIPREIDLEALEDYLTWGIIPGEKSIFRGIRKLPAGHVLTIRAEAWDCEPKRYWNLQLEPDHTLAPEDWLERLEQKLQETVAAHQIADVPVGAFLSGGLDSSLIVALASEQGDSLQTFSVGFQEEGYSELPYARKVADRFATRHHEEIVTADAQQALDDLVYYFDEPFADASAIPTMSICRVARQHVKVVLSGDGGDEAFGGYARYPHDLREARLRALLPTWLRRTLLAQVARRWPKADWLPRPMRLQTTLTNLSLDAAHAYANTLSICRQGLRRSLLTDVVRQQLECYIPENLIIRSYGTCTQDPLRSMIGADTAVLLPDDFLTKVDRASMATGLEVRPPLVDHEFLELAARIPSRLKVRSGQTKWIMKALCRRKLPPEVVNRRKQGFDLPIDMWLRGPLRERLETTVLAPGSRLGDYIQQPVARRLYHDHLRRVGRHGAVLWSLLVLGMWLARWMSCHRPPQGHEKFNEVSVR